MALGDYLLATAPEHRTPPAAPTGFALGGICQVRVSQVAINRHIPVL